MFGTLRTAHKHLFCDSLRQCRTFFLVIAKQKVVQQENAQKI